MNKSIATIALAAIAALPAAAKVEHLLPKVQQLTVTEGSLPLGRTINLTDPTGCVTLQEFLTENGCAQSDDGIPFTVEIVNDIPGAFNHNVPDFPHEAYTLNVTQEGVSIKALTPAGVVRASQTLSQLAQGWEGQSALQCVDITDWPAFKVRGYMHDIGRSFIPFEELKRQVELLSKFKVNVFHWHLTDNTGWRLEIKAYPQLTSDVAITRYPGCYYTQDQAKELQDFAAERGMTVIPEIDMPGHAGPFERAMGHTMQTEQGIQELETILYEVVALFDKAPYIHIGGDEVSFPDQYIVDRINYVHSLGKKAIIWNQYNRSPKKVDPTKIPCDMTTNWATSGTLSAGIPNIDMRYNYTNHFDVFADLVGIYKSTIFGATQGTDDIAGTISAAWNDTKTPTHDDVVRQNNVYANIIASACRAWTGGGKQYIEQGGTVLPNYGDEYDDFADWESRFLFHKETTLAPAAKLIPYVKQADVRWYLTDQLPNGGSNTKALEPEEYLDADQMPQTFTVDGTEYGVRKITGAGHYLRHIWHGNVKGIYDNPQNNMTAYAWTYVYSPQEQDAKAFIETYTYSRSGNETGPLAGKWDRRGSRIWLNGQEIAAPQWQQPGAAIKQDQTNSGLTNENFTNRPATPIHLKEGWNKVFLKLPHVNSGGTARDKWQFTFVIVDDSELRVLPGLIYSPSRQLDPLAETITDLILEARASVNSKIGSLPGTFASTSLDQDLLKACAEIEESLTEELTETQRQDQINRINALLDAFNQGYTATINLPEADKYYYLVSNRNTRYATEQSNALVGSASPSDNAIWSFSPRTDGTYDIVNYTSKRYISPTAANNTQLKTVTSAPSTGWEIKYAAPGYIIIVNGTTQFNQTNQQEKVFNWGGGTKLDDTGCQYRFELANVTITPPDPVDIPDPDVTIVDLTLDGSKPYRVPDALAIPILTSGANTAVLHLTATESTPTAAYVAASNTYAPDQYFSFAVMDGNRMGPRYIGQNSTEGWWTQNASLGTNEVKVAIVADPAQGYITYLNGTPHRTLASSDLGDYGHMHLGKVNATDAPEALFVGGIHTSNNANLYPLKANVHSARFWSQPLTAQQIAALTYTGLTSTEDPSQSSVSTLESSPFTIVGNTLTTSTYIKVYNLQGQLIAAGTGTLNLPSVPTIIVTPTATYKTK